jgi:predicted DNA-binding transcriptional regulator AlpA
VERTTGFEPATLTLASNTSTPRNPLSDWVSLNLSPYSSPGWSGARWSRTPARYPNMLATIDEAAERLRVHRSTIYRLAKDDPTFPNILYIRPRCPRIKVVDLDRWCASQAPTPDYVTVPADLLGGRRRPHREEIVAPLETADTVHV